MEQNLPVVQGRRQRVCFIMRLKPERVADYLAAHRTVWPDMLDALRENGWHDYSLFVHEQEALVVGYLVTDDFETAMSEMSRRSVNERWQAGMAEYFLDGANPDGSLERLTEYFHLD